MSLLYFDIRENGSLIVDEEGHEVSGLQQAEELAIQSLGTILSDRPYKPREITIHIRDADKTLAEVHATVSVKRKA